MSHALRIRQAEPQDRATVKEIIDLSFERFYRYFASRSIDSKEGKLLVAEHDGVVVGFARLVEFRVSNAKYGCILWLAVHPSWRRKGIATGLVDAGFGDLKRKASEAVFASVRRTNKASLATFRKEGFEQMGFVALWRLFSWRILQFYSDIWSVPTEIVFMKR